MYALNWIDDPTLISGGMLTGFNAAGQGSNPNAASAAYIASESTSKANRLNYMMHATYSPLAAPSDFTLMGQIMDGTLFGTPRDVIIGCLGFDGFSTGWPAAGLAAFLNGSMDSTMQDWCNLFNTLPPRPVLFRLWREMSGNSAIYGPNGAAQSPTHGVNETAATYVAAWRYVTRFFKSRCPWVRMLWCPDAGNARALSSTSPWYPGDSFVDWNGIDAYVGGPGLKITANMAPIYGGFNPTSGTVSRKPFMVCESQVARTDASRITDLQDYTSAFTTSMPDVSAICFWDSTSGGTYEITDTPAGFLSAFQTVVSSSPFLGLAGNAPPAILVSQ